MNNNKWKLTSTFVNDSGKLMGIYSHIDNSKKIDQFLDRYALIFCSCRANWSHIAGTWSFLQTTGDAVREYRGAKSTNIVLLGILQHTSLDRFN